MQGKQKCRMLREIRRRIADENDIPFVTQECSFQGECKGTCPKCESELRYLEQQLARREAVGKRVAVAALCAGMTLVAAGCAPARREPKDVEDDLSGAVAYVENDSQKPGDTVETGEIAYPEESEEPGEPYELLGDVAWEGEAEGNG